MNETLQRCCNLELPISCASTGLHLQQAAGRVNHSVTARNVNMSSVSLSLALTAHLATGKVTHSVTVHCHSTRCRLFVCHCAPVLGSPSIHRAADWHAHSDTAWGVGCVRVHSPKVTHSQRDKGRDQGREEGSEGREGGGEREEKEIKGRRRKRKTKSEGKR